MDHTDGKKPEYWNGAENKAIRIFFYAQRGAEIINQFRNPFLLIFGIYFVLKFDNPLWLLLLMVVLFPLICVAGWFCVHRMGKVIDYLNVRFSTHYAKQQFDIFEGILKELKKSNEYHEPRFADVVTEKDILKRADSIRARQEIAEFERLFESRKNYEARKNKVSK